MVLKYFELPVSYRLNSWKLIVRECLGHQCSVIAETPMKTLKWRLNLISFGITIEHLDAKIPVSFWAEDGCWGVFLKTKEISTSSTLQQDIVEAFKTERKLLQTQNPWRCSDCWAQIMRCLISPYPTRGVLWGFNQILTLRKIHLVAWNKNQLVWQDS